MQKIYRGINKLSALITNIASIILFIMLTLTFVQVVRRYVFNNPIMWSEEVTLVMLIWFGYMVIAVGVGEQNHIALESLYLKFNKKVQLVLDGIRHILMAVFSVMMIYYGIDLVKLAKAQYLPASHISRGWLYGVLIFSGVLMTLYSIINFIKIFINEEKEV